MTADTLTDTRTQAEINREAYETSLYKQEVANTILQQMGGRMFKMMTGAKNFALETFGVSFRIETTDFTKNKINHVKIILNGSDYYDVTFSYVRGSKVTQVSHFQDIDCFTLQSLFEEQTGMMTHM